MSDVSSSFDSSGNMDIRSGSGLFEQHRNCEPPKPLTRSIDQNTPSRQPGPMSKNMLFNKGSMPLSPLVNKSSSGSSNLENHGFLIVRKRRSLMVSFMH